MEKVAKLSKLFIHSEQVIVAALYTVKIILLFRVSYKIKVLVTNSLRAVMA